MNTHCKLCGRKYDWKTVLPLSGNDWYCEACADAACEAELERKKDGNEAERHLRGILAVLERCAHFDHSGNCQTHFVERPCRVGAAWEYLERKEALSKQHQADTISPAVPTPPPGFCGGWWCNTCRCYVPGAHVTFAEKHNERLGGCGNGVVALPLGSRRKDAP